MIAVEVLNGGTPEHVRVNAEGHRKPPGVWQNNAGQQFRHRPHKSCLWIGDALRDLAAGDGPIDAHHWEKHAFELGRGYFERPGGTYFVHERGEDPDVWLEGSKAEMVAWLGERGYFNPLEMVKARAAVKARAREESPEAPGLAASVSRHPSGGITAQQARDELERRQAKREAVKGGMSKREACEAFPPASREVFNLSGPELEALAGVVAA